jgi:hypothetical protein
MNALRRLGLIMTLLCVPAMVSAIPIPLVQTQTAGFVGLAAQGPLDQPVLLNSYAEFVATFGGSTAGLANPYLAPSVAGFFANGGVRLAVVRVGALDDNTVIGVDGGLPGGRTGLQALLEVDDVAMIAIPGVATAAVQAAMILHCEQAGDRLAILDPALPGDLAAIQAQRAALSTTNGFGALYFPWLTAAPAGTNLLLPPSGFVAGSYSATDASSSPVGVIATATGLSYDVTTAEQDVLNVQGINAIRNLSGVRIWGARTLAASAEWRYVSVRRMACNLEESLTEGTAWCLGEPNDSFLWTALRQEVDTFLYGRFLAGWLQGTTPSQAYFVQCNANQTMTNLDLAEGRTIIQIGFAPLVPAEFVIQRIVHQRPDLSPVPGGQLSRFTLQAPVPNPFNPATAVAFTLGQDMRISLRILDVGGRVVRLLLNDQPLAAGEHRQFWNGQDESGRGVSSGVYLVQMQGQGEMQARRIVLVR